MVREADGSNFNGQASETLSSSSGDRHQARRHKRNRYFLKGPVPFAWIRDNIPDPTSRVVLVVQAFMDMGRSDECVLTAKVWDCAGISNRYQRRRILARLRKAGGGLEVEDRTGRPSVLRRLGRSTPAAGQH
jgi:hypothetical protein